MLQSNLGALSSPPKMSSCLFLVNFTSQSHRDFPFLLLNSILLCGYTTFYLFTHPLYCFQLLTIVNNVAMNICVQVFVWTPVFIYFGYIPRNTRSCGNFMFGLLRNCQIVSHSDCIILHSQQQCMKVFISLLPHQHFFLLPF